MTATCLGEGGITPTHEGYCFPWEFFQTFRLYKLYDVRGQVQLRLVNSKSRYNFFDLDGQNLNRLPWLKRKQQKIFSRSLIEFKAKVIGRAPGETPNSTG